MHTADTREDTGAVGGESPMSDTARIEAIATRATIVTPLLACNESGRGLPYY
jgi:hypothetical protein